MLLVIMEIEEKGRLAGALDPWCTFKRSVLAVVVFELSLES